MEEIVLVCIVPRLGDWDILVKEHWYHIPLTSAPKITTLTKYLAFYQTKVFGDEKWVVNYYAPVLGYTIKKRIELYPEEVEHPNRDEDYYQIFVDDLVKLKSPIPSLRWRRIVFISTTLKRLLDAREINDLYKSSPIEEKLYEEMKSERILPERQFYVKEGENTYCLDFGIFCKKGKIDVECDGKEFHSGENAHEKDRKRNNELTSYGWSVLRFLGGEINTTPKGCVKKIKRTMRKLGGEE